MCFRRRSAQENEPAFAGHVSAVSIGSKGNEEDAAANTPTLAVLRRENTVLIVSCKVCSEVGKVWCRVSDMVCVWGL